MSSVTAKFHRSDVDKVVYWTDNHFYMYSLKEQQTTRKIEFPYQVTTFAMHPNENLFFFATGRLLTVAELSENIFIYQDYPQHTVFY